MAEDDVLLEFENYPLDSQESVLREVTFGPATPKFALLIEFDPTGGPMNVVVGNGPPHADAPRLLSAVLRDVAQAIENLEDNDEYWVAVNAATITE